MVGGNTLSDSRALKFAGIGTVLVAGALWMAPPAPLLALLGSGEPEATTPPITAIDPPVETAAATGLVNPMGKLTVDDVSEITTRPLFNPDRAGAPPPEPPPDPEPVVDNPPPPPPDVTAADFSLLAVAGPSDALLAMVRFTKTNRVYRVRQGQFVEDWKVAEVNLRTAALERGGTTLSLSLFDGTKPKVPAAPQEPDAGDNVPADGMSGDQPPPDAVDMPVDAMPDAQPQPDVQPPGAQPPDALAEPQ